MAWRRLTCAHVNFPLVGLQAASVPVGFSSAVKRGASVTTLNPTLFEIAGVTVTLAKVVSSIGLLLDIVGVAIIAINEILTRRREWSEAARKHVWAREAPFWGSNKVQPVGTKIDYLERHIDYLERHVPEYQLGDNKLDYTPYALQYEALRETAEHEKSARRMNWRVGVGIVLVVFGFLLQIVGTLLS